MVIQRRRHLWLISLANLFIAVATFSAQAQTIPQEYGGLVTATSQVKGLKPGSAGEEVNLYSGQLGLNQTDVSILGNSQLLVEVTRRFNAADFNSDAGFFEDWDMALPSIHGVFSTDYGWISYGGNDKYKRCSQFAAPPPAVSNFKGSGSFFPEEFWAGTFAFLPGRGDQELLLRDPKTAVPKDGRAYPVVLADGSALSCLNSLDSTRFPATGEGFELVTPDGIRYRFDHMVTRWYMPISKPAPVSHSDETLSGSYLLERTEYRLYPTSVTDRFGNNVIYKWNPANPKQLQSISSSDGREILFTYTDSSGYRIQSISAAGRTWTYSYSSGDTLTQVKLPDQSSWKFNLSDVHRRVARLKPGMGCDISENEGESSAGTVTHPSGVVVSFALKATRFARTYVPRVCRWYGAYLPEYTWYPKEIHSMAIVSKKISGPGLPANGLSWNYAYDNAKGCWDTKVFDYSPLGQVDSAYVCTNTTSGIRTTTVTNPDGSIDQFQFGNRAAVNEGQLLVRRSGVVGSGALRTETLSYAASDAGPYPEYVGTSYQPRGDGVIASRHHPLSKRVIQQDGASFSWSVSKFDTAARPLEIIQTGQ